MEVRPQSPNARAPFHTLVQPHPLVVNPPVQLDTHAPPSMQSQPPARSVGHSLALLVCNSARHALRVATAQVQIRTLPLSLVNSGPHSAALTLVKSLLATPGSPQRRSQSSVALVNTGSLQICRAQNAQRENSVQSTAMTLSAAPSTIAPPDSTQMNWVQLPAVSALLATNAHPYRPHLRPVAMASFRLVVNKHVHPAQLATSA